MKKTLFLTFLTAFLVLGSIGPSWAFGRHSGGGGGSNSNNNPTSNGSPSTSHFQGFSDPSTDWDEWTEDIEQENHSLFNIQNNEQSNFDPAANTVLTEGNDPHTATVPEPATLALLGTGLVWAFLQRKPRF